LAQILSIHHPPDHAIHQEEEDDADHSFKTEAHHKPERRVTVVDGDIDSDITEIIRELPGSKPNGVATNKR
jgi:hypothetical protein